MRWTGYISCSREVQNTYTILIVKHEGKRPLGRARHSWEDNIKIDLKEVWYEGVDWFHIAQDRDQWQTPVTQ
jgi:hypothetical protein